jgi:hypothetical protein
MIDVGPFRNSSSVALSCCSLAYVTVDGLRLSEPKSPGGTLILDQLISVFNVVIALCDLLSYPSSVSS